MREYLAAHCTSPVTARQYTAGLLKLEQYLRLRCHRPAPEKQINWPYYSAGLPPAWVEAIRTYLAHCRRAWPVERQYQSTLDWLRSLTPPLRWIAQQATLSALTDLTPERWLAYLDCRLAQGICAATLNRELSSLQNWLKYFAELGQPICQRLLLVERLDEPPHIPRDVPVEQLRLLLAEIEREAARPHALCRRMGIMDRAWFLLMLYSGLRSGEVRRLQLADFDWQRRVIRIEQSKGLKDRLVPFSPPTAAALQAYLEVRGPAAALPETVFIYRHVPLGRAYCFHRLARYGQRCGVQISPHRLRHSCATLLLNAGAPILTVQAILGHARVDTTLDYARLYDGAIAADYYRAMAQVEGQIKVAEDAAAEPPTHGELLALVDSLRSGMLNDSQTETVRLLRAKLAALAERAATAAPPA